MVAAYETAFAETIMGGAPYRCVAFWRGRVALWTILEAAGIGPGAEVVLPAYTCEVVPAAVRYSGADCVYYDLASRGFSSSVTQVGALVTPRTRLVLCQHTYGIRGDTAGLRSLCDRADILLVEDCCQAIMHGHATGTVGDAAFFSTQWNKPYSTGFGGMAAVRDSDLYERIRARRDGFSRRDAVQRGVSLTAQLLLHHLVGRGASRGRVAEAYRAAQRLRLLRDTSAPEEQSDGMPTDYAAGAINVQAAMGLRALAGWPENMAHRRLLTDHYLEHLDSRWVGPETHAAAIAGPLWAVPLLVRNKDAVVATARRLGLPVHTWFGRVPAHVAPDTCARYGYTRGQCPSAERMFSREVHLPTSPFVTPARAARAVEWLRSAGVVEPQDAVFPPTGG